MLTLGKRRRVSEGNFVAVFYGASDGVSTQFDPDFAEDKKDLNETAVLTTVASFVTAKLLERCRKLILSRPPEIPDIRLDLDSYSPADCVRKFRFEQNEIRLLATKLAFPEVVSTRSRFSAPSWECLCIILYYLAFPRRWCDGVEVFGRSESALSELFNEGLRLINDNFGWLLQLDIQRMSTRLDEFDAAAREFCHLKGLWGFIDGTARKICRPSRGQEAAYSGHKRFHALKYQSVISLDGIIVDLFGPLEGRYNDEGLLLHSNLLERLQQLDSDHKTTHVIYGDSGYAIHPRLISPFQGSSLTRPQKEFNLDMSRIRIAVEWGFNHIITLFPFFEYKRHQRVLQRPVALMFRVAVLLANCHSCLRQTNQTSRKFGVLPPSIDQYLRDRGEI